MDQLEKLVKTDTYATLPDLLKQKVDSAKSTASSYLEQSSTILKNIKSAAKKGTKLDDLSFVYSDLNPAVSDVTKAMKCINDVKALCGK